MREVRLAPAFRRAVNSHHKYRFELVLVDINYRSINLANKSRASCHKGCNVNFKC
jgi:hypothetical protein